MITFMVMIKSTVIKESLSSSIGMFVNIGDKTCLYNTTGPLTIHGKGNDEARTLK